ncbi:MAG: glycosyltransferase family 4 protein [Xenococcaceae cyanobacterium]
MKSKTIKVGFYINNEPHPNADLRFPEKGNPGIGGTDFAAVTVAYYLNKYYPDTVEPLLLANSTELFPPSLNVCQVDNTIDAAVKSEQEKCDIFVFKSSYLNHELWEKLCKLNIKVIARSDNFPDVNILNFMTNCPQIKCHVCVGQEELDLYRDHKIFEKSTRIFHLLNVENYAPKNDISKKGNTVVFLGNLIFYKGFHHLARVWPYILRKKPDAKLIVIGSGKLYDRNNKLGKWGVAEEEYEANYIRPFLSDENGNTIKSVHFAGLLGSEKIEILQNADVGVVNPSGCSETFCISGVEIQACGTPVVSGAKWGLLDTVIHEKTGLLGNNDRDLARNILYLLNNPSIAKQFGENGINFVKDNFSPQLITKQWLDLFIDIGNDRPPQQQPIKSNYLYEAKFLKEGMRILKKSMPPLQNVPALVEIKPLVKRYIKNYLPKK